MTHPASYSMGTGVLSWDKVAGGMKLTTNLHVVLSLRMTGAIPVLLLYAFLARTGTTLLLYHGKCGGSLGNECVRVKAVVNTVMNSLVA